MRKLFFRLTAFVAKSFRQAAPYINVEDKVIQDALHWLHTNQAANGSFPEVGHVSHRDMQGGAAKGLALTAFTLIAFLENQVRIKYFIKILNSNYNNSTFQKKNYFPEIHTSSPQHN